MESWITSTIESLGYAGVIVLMFLENLFPPIPSEVVMPLSGYTAAQGQLSIVGVILAGTFGSVLGALFWYYVARWLGEDRLKGWTRRYGRWITLGPRDVDKADDWFDQHGGWIVFFGRLVPTVRTLVAIPAGLFEMNVWLYLGLTTAGSAIWTAALALVGWWLGANWDAVHTYIDPATYAIMGAIIVVYIYRIVTFDTSEAGTEAGKARRR